MKGRLFVGLTFLLVSATTPFCTRKNGFFFTVSGPLSRRCSLQMRTAPTIVRCCQSPAWITTPRSLLTESGSSLHLSAAARLTSIVCTRMGRASSA
jgi:hypothetical protein